jgi:hypothetical protein
LGGLNFLWTQGSTNKSNQIISNNYKIIVKGNHLTHF